MTRPRCRRPMQPRDGEPQFCGRCLDHHGDCLSEQAYRRLLEAKRKPPQPFPSWPRAVVTEMLGELDAAVAVIERDRRRMGVLRWSTGRGGVMSTGDFSTGELFTKASVHYGEGHPATHCGNCEHFSAGDGTAGDCDIVIGPVRANMWCMKWMRQEGTEPADAPA